MPKSADFRISKEVNGAGVASLTTLIIPFLISIVALGPNTFLTNGKYAFNVLLFCHPLEVFFPTPLLFPSYTLMYATPPVFKAL